MNSILNSYAENAEKAALAYLMRIRRAETARLNLASAAKRNPPSRTELPRQECHQNGRHRTRTCDPYRVRIVL